MHVVALVKGRHNMTSADFTLYSFLPLLFDPSCQLTLFYKAAQLVTCSKKNLSSVKTLNLESQQPIIWLPWLLGYAWSVRT